MRIAADMRPPFSPHIEKRMEEKGLNIDQYKRSKYVVLNVDGEWDKYQLLKDFDQKTDIKNGSPIFHVNVRDSSGILQPTKVEAKEPPEVVEFDIAGMNVINDANKRMSLELPSTDDIIIREDGAIEYNVKDQNGKLARGVPQELLLAWREVVEMEQRVLDLAARIDADVRFNATAQGEAVALRMERERQTIEKAVMEARKFLPELAFMPERNRAEIEEIIKKIAEEQKKSEVVLKKLEEEVEEITAGKVDLAEKGKYYFKHTEAEEAAGKADLKTKLEGLESAHKTAVEEAAKRQPILADYRSQVLAEIQKQVGDNAEKISVSDLDVLNEKNTECVNLLAAKIREAEAKRNADRAQWVIDDAAFRAAPPPAPGKKGKGGDAGPKNPGPQPAVWDLAVDGLKVETNLPKTAEFAILKKTLQEEKAELKKAEIWFEFFNNLDVSNPIDKAILDSLEAKRKAAAAKDKLHKSDIDAGDYKDGAVAGVGGAPSIPATADSPRNKKNIEYIDVVLTELGAAPEESEELKKARVATLEAAKGEGIEFDFDTEKNKLLEENTELIKVIEEIIKKNPDNDDYKILLVDVNNLRDIYLPILTEDADLVAYAKKYSLTVDDAFKKSFNETRVNHIIEYTQSLVEHRKRLERLETLPAEEIKVQVIDVSHFELMKILQLDKVKQSMKSLLEGGSYIDEQTGEIKIKDSCLEAFKKLFTDEPSPDMMKILQEQGIKNWDFFKRLWDNNLATEVAKTMSFLAQQTLERKMSEFISTIDKLKTIRHQIYLRMGITMVGVGGAAMGVGALVHSLAEGMAAADIFQETGSMLGAGVGGLLRGAINRIGFGSKFAQGWNEKKMTELTTTKKKELIDGLLNEMYGGGTGSARVKKQTDQAVDGMQAFASVLAQTMREVTTAQNAMQGEHPEETKALRANERLMYERALAHLEIKDEEMSKKRELCLVLMKLRGQSEEQVQEALRVIKLSRGGESFTGTPLEQTQHPETLKALNAKEKKLYNEALQLLEIKDSDLGKKQQLISWIIRFRDKAEIDLRMILEIAKAGKSGDINTNRELQARMQEYTKNPAISGAIDEFLGFYSGAGKLKLLGSTLSGLAMGAVALNYGGVVIGGIPIMSAAIGGMFGSMTGYKIAESWIQSGEKKTAKKNLTDRIKSTEASMVALRAIPDRNTDALNATDKETLRNNVQYLRRLMNGTALPEEMLAVVYAVKKLRDIKDPTTGRIIQKEAYEDLLVDAMLMKQIENMVYEVESTGVMQEKREDRQRLQAVIDQMNRQGEAIAQDKVRTREEKVKRFWVKFGKYTAGIVGGAIVGATVGVAAKFFVDVMRGAYNFYAGNDHGDTYGAVGEFTNKTPGGETLEQFTQKLNAEAARHGAYIDTQASRGYAAEPLETPAMAKAAAGMAVAETLGQGGNGAEVTGGGATNPETPGLHLEKIGSTDVVKWEAGKHGGNPWDDNGDIYRNNKAVYEAHGIKDSAQFRAAWKEAMTRDLGYKFEESGVVKHPLITKEGMRWEQSFDGEGKLHVKLLVPVKEGGSTVFKDVTEIKDFKWGDAKGNYWEEHHGEDTTSNQEMSERQLKNDLNDFVKDIKGGKTLNIKVSVPPSEQQVSEYGVSEHGQALKPSGVDVLDPHSGKVALHFLNGGEDITGYLVGHDSASDHSYVLASKEPIAATIAGEKVSTTVFTHGNEAVPVPKPLAESLNTGAARDAGTGIAGRALSSSGGSGNVDRTAWIDDALKGNKGVVGTEVASAKGGATTETMKGGGAAAEATTDAKGGAKSVELTPEEEKLQQSLTPEAKKVMAQAAETEALDSELKDVQDHFTAARLVKENLAFGELGRMNYGGSGEAVARQALQNIDNVIGRTNDPILKSIMENPNLSPTDRTQLLTEYAQSQLSPKEQLLFAHPGEDEVILASEPGSAFKINVGGTEYFVDSSKYALFNFDDQGRLIGVDHAGHGTYLDVEIDDKGKVIFHDLMKEHRMGELGAKDGEITEMSQVKRPTHLAESLMESDVKAVVDYKQQVTTVVNEVVRVNEIITDSPEAKVLVEGIGYKLQSLQSAVDHGSMPAELKQALLSGNEQAVQDYIKSMFSPEEKLMLGIYEKRVVGPDGYDVYLPKVGGSEAAVINFNGKNEVILPPEGKEFVDYEGRLGVSNDQEISLYRFPS